MPESWINLVDTEVFAPGKERAAIAAVKGGDDLAAICDEIVEAVRNAYRSGGRVLGPDGQIPSGLLHHASSLALWHFVSVGVPKNDSIQTASRRSGADEAEKYLQLIARRELKDAGGAQIVSHVKRVATRHRLNGL